MTPLETWLTAAVAGLSGFIAWFIRWAITHLESDLAYSRKSGSRGAMVAEKATDIAEQQANGT